eukprot:288898_1
MDVAVYCGAYVYVANEGHGGDGYDGFGLLVHMDVLDMNVLVDMIIVVDIWVDFCMVSISTMTFTFTFRIPFRISCRFKSLWWIWITPTDTPTDTQIDQQ